jgi:hypothetical protein
MQLVAFAAFANKQQNNLNVRKRKVSPTQDPVLEASHGEFFWVLRRLTRVLTQTVAGAARRKTVALCVFDIHVISW